MNGRAGNAMRRALSLTYLGACHWGLGQTDSAREMMDFGLAEARATGDSIPLSRTLMIRGWLETERDIERAGEFADGSVQEARNSVFDAGHATELRGFIACLRGDLRIAEALPPGEFNAAHRRGAQRTFEVALDTAALALRNAILDRP